MAIQAHFCEEKGRKKGGIYPLDFALFSNCTANFCKSVINASQEHSADTSVSSVPVQSQYRASRKTVFHSGCFLARVYSCMPVHTAKPVRRKRKSLAVPTLAWLVRGDGWSLVGGYVGRVSGIIARLMKAFCELLAEWKNRCARATNETHVVTRSTSVHFLHACTPARPPKSVVLNACKPVLPMVQPLFWQRFFVPCAHVVRTGIERSSLNKVPSRIERRTVNGMIEHLKLNGMNTPSNTRFFAFTKHVFLVLLRCNPSTTAISGAQGKRGTSGLRGVLAVVGLAPSKNEKNALPVGYGSSRNLAQQSSTMPGARSSNTRPYNYKEKPVSLPHKQPDVIKDVNMLQIVNVGIDTLKVNLKYLDAQGKPAKVQAFPTRLEEWLAAYQEQAREQNKLVPTSMTFDDARLLMRPNGASVWKYLLTNDSMQLQLVPRLNIPALGRVVFYSPYLWKQASPQDAVDEVHAFCMDVFGPDIMLQAAQVDLCVDVTGFTLPQDWQKVFLSRARGKGEVNPSQKDQVYYRGRKLETVLFSGHGSPFSCKIYDKIQEIKQRSPDKVWFYDLWKRGGWNGEDRVWRLEFSVEREGLHEVEIEDVYDALRNLKRMWAYCTHEWLRMVTPLKTKNRTRWPTAPAWLHIQHAFDDYGCKLADALGPLVRERKREVNIERGVAAFAGYATTFAGWCEDEENDLSDPDTLLALIASKVQERWNKQETSLPEVIKEKKFLYSRKG